MHLHAHTLPSAVPSVTARLGRLADVVTVSPTHLISFSSYTFRRFHHCFACYQLTPNVEVRTLYTLCPAKGNQTSLVCLLATRSDAFLFCLCLVVSCFLCSRSWFLDDVSHAHRDLLCSGLSVRKYMTVLSVPGPLHLSSVRSVLVTVSTRQ